MGDVVDMREWRERKRQAELALADAAEGGCLCDPDGPHVCVGNGHAVGMTATMTVTSFNATPGVQLVFPETPSVS